MHIFKSGVTPLLENSLKIAWLGNLGNVGFNSVKLLRESRVEASLFLEKSYLNQYGPGNPNYEYQGAATESFVKLQERDLHARIIHKLGFKSYCEPYARHIGKNFSIIQAQTTNEITAQRISRRYGIPYTALTTGADLSELAYEDSPWGHQYRQALNEASHIFLVNTDQFNHLRRLNLDHRPHSFLPFNIHCNRFHRIANEINKKTIFFSIARLDWCSKVRHSIKRNDIFFRGFAEYCRNNENNFELWIADWGVDKEATRALIADLGISGQTKFIQTGDKSYLYELLKSVNVVVDQFHLGAVGLATLEAMAMSRPVFAYCDEIGAKEAYDETMPVFNCSNEQEVYAELCNMTADRIQNQSKLAYDWVQRHHSENVIFKKLHGVYASLASCGTSVAMQA